MYHYYLTADDMAFNRWAPNIKFNYSDFRGEIAWTGIDQHSATYIKEIA